MQSIQPDVLKGHWFGPMPVDIFFNEFMPNRDALSAALFTDAYFSCMPQALSGNCASQKSMEEKLLKLIREAAAHSGAKLGTNMEYLIEVRHGPQTACDPFHLEPIYTVDEEIARSDIFIDTAGKLEYPGHIFDCKCTQFCRGSLSKTLQDWFNLQPRTHGFVLYVGDPWVRFIRIDRAGAVFSERFNFRETSSRLLSYIWRFSNMSIEETGLDTTIRSPNLGEISLAKPSLKQVASDYGSRVYDKPAMVVKIPDRETGEMREVVSCWPLNQSTGLTGRGTRAWPAYDLTLGKVVYFKESWRSLEKGMQKESSILTTLNEAGIKHVPQLICGDDMKGEWFKTKSQRYQDAKWNYTGSIYQLAPRIAHRFTVDLIGIHLEKFGSTRNLLGAVYDAFIAHRDAYKICNILHCDISSNNILMDGTGRGFLNDWDMARTVDTLKHSDSSVGTWRFMSLGLLLDQRKNNDVHDDIESFFYLVVYFLLRYARHNKSEKNTVKNLISTVFDDPQGKLRMSENLTSDWVITDNDPMNKWLYCAGSAVKEWTNHLRQGKEKCENFVHERRRGNLKDHEYFIYLFERFLESKKHSLAWPDPKDDAARDCLKLG